MDRATTAPQKLLTSAINAAAAATLTLPFLLIPLSTAAVKTVFLCAFLAENLAAIAFSEYRLPGMLYQGTRWKERYPLRNQVLHAFLYTASASTLVFHIRYPFDLFLINILLVQLPCVLLTGTTVHGYLSGNMVDVASRRPDA